MYTQGGRSDQFNIRPGGIHPQAGQSYHYSDGQYDFWFYVDFKAPPKVEEPTLFVVNATTERFSGGMPAVNHGDRIPIEKNIQSHFEKVDILDRPISPSNPSPRIAFVWRLAQ
jgi:hypothetical protein